MKEFGFGEMFQGENDPNLAVEAYSQAVEKGMVKDGVINVNVSSRDGSRTQEQQDAMHERLIELNRRLVGGPSPEEKDRILSEIDFIEKGF